MTLITQKLEERAAHIAAALAARRTSHQWMAMARDWPKDAPRFHREASQCRERARYEIKRARSIAAWVEWKQQNRERIAA